jgi:hypothetical protein
MDRDNFNRFYSYDESHGPGRPDGEPSEDSVEDVSQLEGIDEELRQAGKLPSESEVERLSDDEIRHRIKEKVDELRQNGLEISLRGRNEIRDFLTTMRILGVDTASEEEIEILWRSLNQSPSLVKDFTLHLITRKTKNHYSEFPLLPDMRDLLEFSEMINDPQVVRPRLIKESADNFESLGIKGEKITSLAMSQNVALAEGTRFLGWLAGFPFMRGANQLIENYMEEMEIDSLTVEHVAHVFIMIVSQNIYVLKERAKKTNYNNNMKMDHNALNTHAEVLDGMQAIQDMLYRIFIEK